MPELLERSRGKLSYAPAAWTNTQPDYPKKKSVLDWQPPGVDYNGNPGESIRQVRDIRVWPVLRVVDEFEAGETIALSTHAEWLTSLRAYYLGFDDTRFRQPLFRGAPPDNRALTTAKMIINGQIDMYKCTCSPPIQASSPERHMDAFRTIITEPGLQFDTDWINIKDM